MKRVGKWMKYPKYRKIGGDFHKILSKVQLELG